MAERRELALPRTTASSLRERLARITLHNVREQGHTYVELREDGKRFIFFCTLCLCPCYSDSALFDHLRGSLHTERLSAAKVTLLGPNRWPFNDGVLFFENPCEKEKQLKHDKLLECHNNDNNLAIVEYTGNYILNNYGCDGVELNCGESAIGIHAQNGDCGNCDKVIPGVYHKSIITDLKVRFIGIGKLSARMLQKGKDSAEISKIWCEWLGKDGPADKDTDKIPDHDFAIITFAYTYDLGRHGLFDDVKLLLSSSHSEELESSETTARKRKKSFSDPEDVSESLSIQSNSSGEVASASSSATSSLLLGRYDDQLLDTRFISSKSIRRELRRQQRVAAERMCDICQQKILLDKDVAALMNTKTGKLVCSSRNMNGLFHVFHISCLIHWILLCEYEIMMNCSVKPKWKHKSRRKNGANQNELGKAGELISTNKIHSVLCPVCQGTGVHIEGDKLEEVTITLSQMFKYKIKVSDAHRAWMKNPEVLPTCSTGFHFPPQSEEMFQEKVLPLKLLHFYSASEE
ncbi:uncharacterized protein LOC123196462 [Mangifera indica]|uniref:uncharacterized protein LOC123196462 n=1 Tax=Mangifera indica TaxID=29780 RepID=UPI001CF9E9B5|nr:uncharacterized protein LOC123196462 [Mangifera indica]